MNFNKKGLFISFEGPEASGKSTQIKILQKFLKKNNISHIITREPGGTRNAEKLRNIILDYKNPITKEEEILLLMSSRINHINEVILPALNKKKLVITDRFADSTFVYQGYVNNYGLKKTIQLHKQILNNFLPSKTFLFNLHSKEIVNRLSKRKKRNKYDKIDLSFHNKVNTGYKKLSFNNKRFILIDANNSVQNIHQNILSHLYKILK